MNEKGVPLPAQPSRERNFKARWFRGVRANWAHDGKDALYEPVPGGLVFIYQQGTTLPCEAFIDAALTILHPHPIALDAYGEADIYMSPGQLVTVEIRAMNTELVDRYDATT